MADNVLNAVVDDFVGHRDRLLRIAGVVIFDGHQLVALMPPLALMSLIA